VGRLRAYFEFLAAVLYFFLARSMAHMAVLGLSRISNDPWIPLLEQAIFVFFLILGYGGLGLILDRELHPISAQGLPRRAGRGTEFGLGLAIGWAIAVVCVLLLTLGGGIAISLSLKPAAWGWLVADAGFFALAALAEEVAFRGYGFQRFALAVGPTGAAFGFAAFYAVVQSQLRGSTRISIAVSIVFSLLLSTAYLRTRALWLSWGLNFAWKASRALLFGLAVSGVTNHSPVVQGDPMGPFWLTGGGFGLDGSWLTLVVLLVALPVVFRLTRELDYKYNAPVIVPGGMPVDLDAAARSQHEAATRTAEPKPPALVQILPVTPAEPAASAHSASAVPTQPEQ
jgi:membrane protease YdiL (CAAX protease family)